MRLNDFFILFLRCWDLPDPFFFTVPSSSNFAFNRYNVVLLTANISASLKGPFQSGRCHTSLALSSNDNFGMMFLRIDANPLHWFVTVWRVINLIRGNWQHNIHSIPSFRVLGNYIHALKSVKSSKVITIQVLEVEPCLLNITWFVALG